MVLELGMVVLGVGLLVFVTFVSKSIYLVKQAETIIIERFGRFERILMPGIHFVIPFMEAPRQILWSYVLPEGDGKRYYRFSKVTDRIDLREAFLDFPKQNVITKDNVTMEINALMYYQITDPKSAAYEVANLAESIEKLTQTTLRNIIGAMDLDETLMSRDVINEKLRLILDESTDRWGVKVNRVELQEVNPPHDIRIAMEKQMRAERDRRAVILESEGKKSSAILEAEGEKEAAILEAQGHAEARMINAQGEAVARLKIAEAEAKAIDMIKQVTPQGDPLSYMIATQYIKALPEITKGKNDKLIVVPYEMSSLVSSVASIKKVFDAAS